ncbi:MAG: hypothetical protein AB8B48_18705 [Pseudomonadales bacterium]
MSDLDDDTVNNSTDIPVLDRIVKPSKQKDLADLLIKIIQTNEAEDKASLTEYDVDVSSATLRDIDEKLSAALHTTSQEQVLSIPMLTEIADFPVIEGARLPFQNSDDSDNEQIGLPAMHSVNTDTDAANSAQQPTSANQDRVAGKAVFSFPDDGNRAPADAQDSKQDFDLGLDTSQKAANQHTLLQEQLNQSTRQIIDELIAEHSVAIRHELESRIGSLKQELLSELTPQVALRAESRKLPKRETDKSLEHEGSDA